ncbi:MAG: exodeoxyribonuclease V subunit beta [Myxococcales bacterium]|nr:exodeoxyribonuclease V subunit beta [Myxococcales bacterium]MDH3483124.1 exodeoxyribonuclease V subunit beta [Myxococcales bacterium]
MSVNTERVSLGVPVLVEASAGTGKTHAITTYFVRAILERDLSPEQVLVVTYTKAATAELRIRTRERVIEAMAMLDGAADRDDGLTEIVGDAVQRLGRATVEGRLRAASSQMDQAPILTIHGFCQRLLQDYPLSFGIDVDFDLAEESVSVFYDLAVDFWTTELHDSPEWLLLALKKRRISPERLGKLADRAMTPGIGLLGPEPKELDTSVVDRWFELIRQAKAIWREERDSISAILLEDLGLNRTNYPIASVRNIWIPGLDDFFAVPSFELPSWFERLAQTKMKTKKRHERPKHAFFEVCDRLTESGDALKAAVEHAVFAFQERFIEVARAQSRKRRRERGVLTYDDLLLSVHESLDSDTAAVIRAKYPIALVDEFQDTDAIQWGIFKSIYDQHGAVYVGDPKQSIYAFRGADVFSYLEAARDVGESHLELTTNRRSDPSLVEAVNTLFSSQPAPFVFDDIKLLKATASHESRSSLDPAIEILFLYRETASVRSVEETIPALVANEIALLLESKEEIEGRQICPNDIAVLCRKNKQALLVTEALRTLGIPSSLDGDSSVLSTEIADDIEAVLEAALMPGNASTVRRAILTPLLGVSPYELNTMDDEDWSRWVTLFRGLHEKWQNEGVVRFLEELLRTTGAETRVATHPLARRKLTDLLHIEELLLRGERERRRDPVALLLWFRRLRQGSREDTMVPYEELQQRPDAESDTVRVTTIHKSKGLEYGIVYCPFPWKDAILFDFEKKVVKFHDPDDALKVKIDLGSSQLDAHLEISKRETLSEALRLLYVAVTRAKHRCTLFWGLAAGWERSALSYLLHGDADSKSMDDEQALADVEALIASSKGTIGWRPPRLKAASSREPEAPADILRARDATRQFSQANRIASFTSLTGNHEKTAPRDPEADVFPPPAALFSCLPGGARTGLLLHSILERVNLSELQGEEAEQLIEHELGSYGYDPALRPDVLTDLQTIARTPLTGSADAPRLEDIPQDQQLRELEFTLSVDDPDFVALSRILKKHDAPKGAPGYPERLASETTGTLKSFLRGFIDLVFEWEGRWYVVDYKSNSLSKYEHLDVTEAAARAHYLLQMQLYAAAVNRYLGQRVPCYDPERHWGGALLLFLRGMKGPDAPGSSIFFERQTPALIRAVDEWLGRST